MIYSDGKVCLSLLGTWAGEGGENWTSASTLMQVFQSIQSLIMSSDILFNEPGYARMQDTAEGTSLNQGYTNIVRYGAVKFAMLDQLRQPSREFDGLIQRHFLLMRPLIRAQCTSWLEDARSESGAAASYGSLIQNATTAILPRNFR